jgi:hypothetical protein
MSFERLLQYIYRQTSTAMKSKKKSNPFWRIAKRVWLGVVVRPLY